MIIEKFNSIIKMQLARCESLLCDKGKEYSPGTAEQATPENNTGAAIPLIEEPDGQLTFQFDAENDRLAHFKKAAVIMNASPKEALLGMLSKHLVSVSDMCTDKREYSLARWDEKITDSINYLLILRALVEEEHHEQN